MSWDAAGAEPMASFGETLKRERELREISLRQISEATKINIRYLAALEENRFEVLPGGLFNKGFIRAYSAYVGIDGETMVNSYLHEVSIREPGADSAGAREQPLLHRPLEVPQRRATPRPGDAGRDRPVSGSIPVDVSAPKSTGPGGPEGPSSSSAGRTVPEQASPGQPPPVRGVTGRAPTAPTGGENALLDSLGRPQAPRPAVTGIEFADPATPRSSRVLLWILSLVAGAGVLFLVLSLLRGTKPPFPGPVNPPAGRGIGGAESPEVKADPARVGRPAAPAGAPDLLPEMSSTTPISLGALDAPGPKAPPAVPAGAVPRASAPARAEQHEPSPAPEARHREEPPAAPAGKPRGPMDVALEARGRTFVQLLCDGNEMVNRVLEAGEIVRARCLGIVRVSAADAGSTRISVNGSPCLPLGDPGARAYGYTIRIDDYARICPPGGREPDGRP